MAKCTGIRCPMQYGYKVDECNHTDCPHRTEPATNADRIRAATNVELVNALETMCYGMKSCGACVLYGKCPVNKPGVKDPESVWSEWLKQPADDPQKGE